MRQKYIFFLLIISWPLRLISGPLVGKLTPHDGSERSLHTAALKFCFSGTERPKANEEKIRRRPTEECGDGRPHTFGHDPFDKSLNGVKSNKGAKCSLFRESQRVLDISVKTLNWVFFWRESGSVRHEYPLTDSFNLSASLWHTHHTETQHGVHFHYSTHTHTRCAQVSPSCRRLSHWTLTNVDTLENCVFLKFPFDAKAPRRQRASACRPETSRCRSCWTQFLYSNIWSDMNQLNLFKAHVLYFYFTCCSTDFIDIFIIKSVRTSFVNFVWSTL